MSEGAPEVSGSLVTLVAAAVAGVAISAVLLRVLLRRGGDWRGVPAAPERLPVELGAVALVCMLLQGVVAAPLVARYAGQDPAGSGEEGAATDIVPLLLIQVAMNAAIVVAVGLVARARRSGFLAGLGLAMPSWRDAGLAFAGLLAIAPAYLVTAYLNTELAARAGLVPHQHLVRALLAESSSLANPLVLVAAGILTPLFEEILFRGLLLRALLHATRSWVAIVVSAAAFAMVHDRQVWLPVFSLGVLFALLFARTGSILAPFFAHAAFNTAQLLIMASISES